MVKLDLLSTLAGALISLFPTLITIYIKDRLSNKRLVKKWLVDDYIPSHIDHIRENLNFWRDRMMGYITINDEEGIPKIHRKDINEIEKLLDNKKIKNILHQIRNFRYSARSKHTTVSEFTQISCEYLSLALPIIETLRQNLLDAKIKDKNDIYKIEFSEELKKQLNKLDERYETQNFDSTL